MANSGGTSAPARSGHAFCKKIELKNFYDPKPAGGCGVAPILSAGRLFCRADAQPVPRCADDLFMVVVRDGRAFAWRIVRLRRSGDGQ
ncbi:hypothetical protein EXT69_14730 [Pantoea agglomerans]|nr:hypothetical protein [Pantoea agglomerans]